MKNVFRETHKSFDRLRTNGTMLIPFVGSRELIERSNRERNPLNQGFLNALIHYYRTTLLVFLLILATGSCTSTQPTRAYQSETFATESPFLYYSSREPDGACEIGKRALLSQGYQIDGTQSLNIRGEKYFQPKVDQVMKLTITLVCLPSSLGAVIYANALETQFELKSRGSSAGMSISGFGSLSLPWAADKDTLVKTGDITITEPGFYQKLFELIKTLDG